MPELLIQKTASYQFAAPQSGDGLRSPGPAAAAAAALPGGAPRQTTRSHDVSNTLHPSVVNKVVRSIPTSRNAFDRVAEGFENGKSKSTACTCANNGPCELGAAREEGGAGQPCLWWSQVAIHDYSRTK